MVTHDPEPSVEDEKAALDEAAQFIAAFGQGLINTNYALHPLKECLLKVLVQARAEGYRVGHAEGRTEGIAEGVRVSAEDARAEGERAGREAERAEVDTIRSQRDEAESRLTLAFIECVKPVADAYITHGERYWSLRDGIERFLRERGRVE